MVDKNIKLRRYRDADTPEHLSHNIQRICKVLGWSTKLTYKQYINRWKRLSYKAGLSASRKIMMSDMTSVERKKFLKQERLAKKITKS
jgi:hypothetical protein